MKTILNLHGIIPSSRVNGPGSRCVVFFQGCARGCPGCFNPSTHPLGPNTPMTVEEVLLRVPRGSSGLTISGGEPFLQPRGLGALLGAARRALGLPSIVYTGYTLDEIEADRAMAGLLPMIDLLVAGPYERDFPERTSLASGSTNQVFHFLSSRYREEDLYLPARLEVTIAPDGSLTGTGFSRLMPLMGTT